MSALFKQGNSIKWVGTEGSRKNRTIKGFVKTNEKLGNTKIEIEKYNINNNGKPINEKFRNSKPTLLISKNKLMKTNENVQKSNTSSVALVPSEVVNSSMNFAKFKVGSNVIYTTKAGNNKIYVVQPTTEQNQIVIRPTGVTNNKLDKIIKTKNEFEKLRKRPMPENVDWRNEVLKEFPIGTKVTYKSKDAKTNRVGIISAKLYLSNGKESIKINTANKFPNASQITSPSWISERQLKKI
jgi:hypothetical protein